MSRSRDGLSAGDNASRLGGANGGPVVNTTVVLPNIPRTTDDKAKIKYMTDYERYEPELRKHHLGGPDTSVTIGLKDVPVEFNRAVPSLNEPTAAEREYERALQLKAKLRNRNRFHIAKPPAAKRPTPPADASGPAVAAADGSTAAALSMRGDESATAASTEQQQQQHGRVQSAHGDQTASPTTADTSGATGAPPPKKPVRISPPSAGRDSLSPSPAAAALLNAPSTPGGAAPDSATAAGGRSRARTVGVSSPLESRRRSRRRSTSSPAPKQRWKPVDVEMALLEAVAQPPMFDTGAGPDAYLPPPSSTVAECASILRVLVDTPPEYMSSFHLDTDFFDLRWVSNKTRPSALCSLQNTSLFSDPAAAAGGPDRPRERLTSPRSVIVMLRNGVDPHDLSSAIDAAAATGASSSGVLRSVGPQLLEAPELRQAVTKYRAERDKAHRERLRNLLLSDYSSLCQQMSVEDLVGAVQQIIDADRQDGGAAPVSHELPTSVTERIARQQKSFAANKLRIQRQLELMKEVNEQHAIAEARKAQAEAEARAELERKAQEEEEARQRQRDRLVQQQLKNAAIEAATKEQMEERLRKAEARSQERLAAQERQRQQRQQQRAAVAAERQLRFQRSIEVQEAQAAAIEQKRVEKERRLEEIQHEREARLAEERRELVERQQRAAAAREEAKLRAEQARQAAHEAAIEKQKEVEARLDAFQQQRQEEAAERAKIEAEKDERRLAAFQSARQQQVQFREKIVKRAQQHEEALDHLQSQRELERAIRRERDREEAAVKRFAVKRKQRIDEFNKLHTIADLITKRKAANYVTAVREQILDQSMKARSRLVEERDRLREELKAANRMVTF